MSEVSTQGVNPGAAEFPHRQIATTLRARIRRGDWQPGERLPSIPALAGMFGVAKQTIQRTVDQLRVEGLLITKPGSGTYVRGTRRRLNRLSRGRYGAQRGYHADLAARYRQQLMSVGREPAPPEVADAFGVPDNTELVVRRYQVRTQDATVSQMTVEVGASWFRTSDVAGSSIERAEAFGRPVYQEVEEVTGRRYTSATDVISARLPTREEAELLAMRPDTPVLHLLHVAFDEHHKPLEVALSTWPGPMTTLTEDYKIPAPRPEEDYGDESDIALG
ncbi:GntR family transcriptional regulator [Hamadaea tsunoensis]|uniref:GntR family transcriptional regulator n=1 Tax=Hamadaea tsunoensis TaxID=53368 RepID=UPI0004805A69|nr:GntR family transcriptional regulator [Hamadaea tsunoensis]